MSTATTTARCVHCLWRTDLEGKARESARATHELVHPGGTVAVGPEPELDMRPEITVQLEPPLEPAAPRAHIDAQAGPTPEQIASFISATLPAAIEAVRCLERFGQALQELSRVLRELKLEDGS